MNKNFFAGLEELFARLASFLLVILGFIIFILARNVNFVLDWLSLIQVLALFCIIYEVLGLIFFQAFHFFARQQIIPNIIPITEPIINLEPNFQSKTPNLTEKIEPNSKNSMEESREPVIEEVEVIKSS